MPRLVIRSKGHADTRFEIERHSIVIGRSPTADVVLTNVSVSREHARMVKGVEGWFVQDLSSKSGTLVNGEVVATHTLTFFDEIQIGRFTLVFLGDTHTCKFLDGRFVEYLAPYRELGDPAVGETIPLSQGAMKRLREHAHRKDKAKVVSVLERGKSWPAGDRDLTFGGKGLIDVQGMFTSGIVASIRWESESGGHILRKQGLMVTVAINDHDILEQTLLPGDTFKVGKTRFRYVLD